MIDITEIEEHMEYLSSLGKRGGLLDFKQMSIRFSHSDGSHYHEGVLFDEHFMEGFFSMLEWAVEMRPSDSEIKEAYGLSNKHVMKLRFSHKPKEIAEWKKCIGERNAANYLLGWTLLP